MLNVENAEDPDIEEMEDMPGMEDAEGGNDDLGDKR